MKKSLQFRQYSERIRKELCGVLSVRVKSLTVYMHAVTKPDWQLRFHQLPLSNELLYAHMEQRRSRRVGVGALRDSTRGKISPPPFGGGGGGGKKIWKKKLISFAISLKTLYFLHCWRDMMFLRAFFLKWKNLTINYPSQNSVFFNIILKNQLFLGIVIWIQYDSRQSAYLH